MQRLVRSLVLACAALLGLVQAASAAPSPTGQARATGWYLALGDSLAAGYQPGAGDDLAGGYVGHVLDAVQATSPKTRLVNLACSGETSVTLVAGGRCDYELGSQLAQAVDFLEDHGQLTRLVTIDIGANDVQRCVSRPTPTSGFVVDEACIGRGMTDVATNLPRVLGTLRALAPHARFVVLDYYNPFLAAWLTGTEGQTVALQSSGLQHALNAIIAGAAAGTGAGLADVSGAFHSDDWTVVTAPGIGAVPRNVATICAWTWMCTRGDIHADDAGYAVLGQAVAARL